MKKLLVLSLAASLAGCATMAQRQIDTPAPIAHRLHKPIVKKPVVVASPAPVAPPTALPAPPAKPTFKERWQTFKKKHPVKWFHH